MQVKIVT